MPTFDELYPAPWTIEGEAATPSRLYAAHLDKIQEINLYGAEPADTDEQILLTGVRDRVNLHADLVSALEACERGLSDCNEDDNLPSGDWSNLCRARAVLARVKGIS